MLKEIRNIIAFLTIIPVGMSQDCILDAAKHMYLFPLVGALIGFLAGVFARLLHIFFAPLLVGILTTGFILLITGLHHTDGLLDFGDGLMYQGPPEEKIKIMRDQQTGVGGFALGFIALSTTILCIAGLRRSLIIQSLVASETCAKLAMVTMARIGKSACDGMNKPFIHYMHGPLRNVRLAVALSTTLCIAVPLLGLAGLASLAASLITSVILVGVSNRHFKGLTGDIFGAGNELARLGSLLAIVVTS